MIRAVGTAPPDGSTAGTCCAGWPLARQAAGACCANLDPVPPRTASQAVTSNRKEYDVITTSIADQNRELIRQVYTLANAGELGQIASFYAEDYRLTQSPGHPVPGSWIGREATEASIRVFNTCGTNRVTIHEIIADGPHRVIGIVDAHGTTPGGMDWTMPISEHFWIEDGKITDIRPFYWDPAGLRRLIEMA